MVPSNRRSIIHRVESRNLVNAHRRHLQYLCNLVHHTYTREAMLSLAQVEEGHDRCFLVLRGIAFEDLGDKFLVDCIEFEGDRGIVVVSVPMLAGENQSVMP